MDHAPACEPPLSDGHHQHRHEEDMEPDSDDASELDATDAGKLKHHIDNPDLGLLHYCIAFAYNNVGIITTY